jgi:hypothetical protein
VGSASWVLFSSAASLKLSRRALHATLRRLHDLIDSRLNGRKAIAEAFLRRYDESKRGRHVSIVEDDKASRR